MTDAQPLISPTDLVPVTRREGDAVVATVSGDVDLHNSPELRGALLELLHRGKPRKLVLNLGGVTYMDSSGIAVLVEMLGLLRRGGGKVYLTNLQPRVRSILEIARLNTIFVLTGDEAAALAK
jgi:anti-sigma B factor antagonist